MVRRIRRSLPAIGPTSLSWTECCYMNPLSVTSLATGDYIDSFNFLSSQVGSSQMKVREAAVTRMLVVVCVVYMVCTLPTVTHAFFRYFLPEFSSIRRLRNTFYATVSLMHLMASINASGNFLIYLSVSTKFKETLKGMFSTGKSGRREGSGRTNHLDTTRQTHISSSATDY